MRQEVKGMGRYFVTYLFAVAFLALPLSVYCEQSDIALVLTSESLGPLPLSRKTVVSESCLKKLFPKYRITHEIGSGDSPDFHFFRIIDKEGDLLFTIKSFIEDSDQHVWPPNSYAWL
jgi:hypothetical protein